MPRAIDTNASFVNHLQALQILKGIGLCWIFLNHVLERSVTYPLIANPSADWGTFQQRVEQLWPVHSGQWWDLPMNALRYLGLSGETGVQLFLIASGFGLAISSRRRQQTELACHFYRRRLRRILPLWWTAHLLALLASIPILVFIGGRFSLRAVSIGDPEFWLSFFGLRVTIDSLYYGSPSWWFIALILQLYLIYPWLERGIRRYGAYRTIGLLVAVSWAVRAWGLVEFSLYRDAWSRGAIFITRFPEFLFGVALALAWSQSPEKVRKNMCSTASVLFGWAIFAIGISAALTLWGNTFSPALLGIGATLGLYRFADRLQERALLGKMLTWIGNHAFALMLVHHPIVFALCPGHGGSPARIFTGTLLATVISAIAAIVLEQCAAGLLRLGEHWSGRGQLASRVGAIAAVFLACWLSLVYANERVAQTDPQEVMGWGERQSLQPDEELGWKLRPNITQRLRWRGYDYTVRSNEWGFPGPAQVPATGDSIDLLVLGDAFCSAEGIDTERSWPRLLERKLGSRLGRTVQVANFGITGYGPVQYATVAEKYVPKLRPRLVVVGMFVNDFLDSDLAAVESTYSSIGFDLPRHDSWQARFRLGHLGRVVRAQLTDPLLARLRGRTTFDAEFFGQLWAYRAEAVKEPMLQSLRTKLVAIERVAARHDASVCLVLIPAAPQVCSLSDLQYMKGHQELDPLEYDLDQPQRHLANMAKELGLWFIDLRDALRDADACPYFANNLHWNKTGHRVAAEALVDPLSTMLLAKSNQ